MDDRHMYEDYQVEENLARIFLCQVGFHEFLFLSTQTGQTNSCRPIPFVVALQVRRGY